MSQDPIGRKQEVIARAGLGLAFFIFLLASIATLEAGARPIVPMILGAIAGWCLWGAIFASKEVAVFLGRWFP
jgi:hypothetical protein